MVNGEVVPVGCVDPATLTNLPRMIGPARMKPYLETQANSADEAIRLYSWNIEASAAFLGAMSVLEVGLRNAIHEHFRARAEAEDWWNSTLFVTVLDTQTHRFIDDAERFLRKKKRTGWGPGHVVAELSFAFWVGLLTKKYHKSLWLDRSLAQAFPHYFGRRDALAEKIDRLRLLRNRAAHHEPIHQRDLMVDLRFMAEVCGYIHPELKQWVDTHSRLPRVIRERANTISFARPTRF